jgi:hypothetical protein
MRSRNENTDGVAFVSGIQGVIVTTSLVEVDTPHLGGKPQSLVSGCVGVVTHTEAFIKGVTTQN